MSGAARYENLGMYISIQDILKNHALFLHLAKFGGTRSPCTPSFVATERYKIYSYKFKKMFPAPKN